MKLRAKLFIPLLLFSLIFGYYFRFVWLPNITDSMLHQSEQSWHAHLTSVAEGLIPLLLESQLANVYENLDALLEENKSWLSIQLIDNKGNRLYPLSPPLDPASFPPHTQTYRLSVGFVEPALARLEVTRDITPLLEGIAQLEKHLGTALLILLILFVVITATTLELQVRRRLKQLSLAADQLSAGDYSTALPAKSGDEIGDLTHAFHRMRSALSLYHQQLHGEIDNHKRSAEALEEEKDRASFQAAHDPLTGLINRREFERRLTEALHQANLDNSNHSLLYLDLDQFKIINDTCGHVAGDALLQQLRHVLQDRLRQNDSLARLGGDEFGVLLQHCHSDHALKVAESMRQAIQDFLFVWEGKSFSLGVSIGAVGIDRHSGGISSLLSAADSACYLAKHRGRNQVQLYKQTDDELNSQHSEMHWVNRLKEALNNDRFELFCQPIVTTARTEADQHYFEILLRLREENGDLIPPGAFLPAAERYDLIVQLDSWVVDHAFDYLQQWGHPEKLRFAINLSCKSLGDTDFLNHIDNRLRRGDIEGHEICFEVTESAAISSLSSTRFFMESLKLLGCYFSLDDFGRGMSSFSYLKNLPVNHVKIDGALIRDIVDDPICRAIVNAINQVAHTMQLKTIAEFVQNQQILDELQQLEIDYVQGSHIGMPFSLTLLPSYKPSGTLHTQGNHTPASNQL